METFKFLIITVLSIFITGCYSSHKSKTNNLDQGTINKSVSAEDFLKSNNQVDVKANLEITSLKSENDKLKDNITKLTNKLNQVINKNNAVFDHVSEKLSNTPDHYQILTEHITKIENDMYKKFKGYNILTKSYIKEEIDKILISNSYSKKYIDDKFQNIKNSFNAKDKKIEKHENIIWEHDEKLSKNETDKEQIKKTVLEEIKKDHKTFYQECNKTVETYISLMTWILAAVGAFSIIIQAYSVYDKKTVMERMEEDCSKSIKDHQEKNVEHRNKLEKEQKEDFKNNREELIKSITENKDLQKDMTIALKNELNNIVNDKISEILKDKLEENAIKESIKTEVAMFAQKSDSPLRNIIKKEFQSLNKIDLTKSQSSHLKGNQEDQEMSEIKENITKQAKSEGGL